MDVKVNTVENFLCETIFHFFKGGCLSTRAHTKKFTRSIATLES